MSGLETTYEPRSEGIIRKIEQAKRSISDWLVSPKDEVTVLRELRKHIKFLEERHNRDGRITDVMSEVVFEFNDKVPSLDEKLLVRVILEKRLELVLDFLDKTPSAGSTADMMTDQLELVELRREFNTLYEIFNTSRLAAPDSPTAAPESSVTVVSPTRGKPHTRVFFPEDAPTAGAAAGCTPSNVPE